MDITAFVGPAIRTLRDKAGISQEELAGRASLDRTYVSGIERSARNPSVKSLQKIADALDVSLDVLFIEARRLTDTEPQAKASRAMRPRRRVLRK